MARTLLRAAFAAGAILVAGPALAAGAAHADHAQSVAEVQKTQFVDEKGVAIRGYDPVSYFAGTGVAGAPQFASKYHGATYLFANAANKAKFDATPAAYVPQYGGYCAYGTAVGKKFKTDPATGTVVKGKLYFNKDKSVQETWNKDVPGYIVKANGNWPAVQKRDVDG